MMKKTLLIVVALAFLLLCLLPLTLAAEPVPSPGVEILATGCSPCATGDRATFVLTIANPGPARGVRLVALLRHPAGAVYPLRGNGDVILIPSGGSSIVLADFSVPAGAPGVFLVESAILDPTTGTTLSRAVLGIIKE